MARVFTPSIDNRLAAVQENLRASRLQLGMSQHISRLEAGKQEARISTLLILADALGLSMRELFE